MSYRYEDFIWKIIYKVLSKEKHLNITIDKDKQNTENIDEKVVDNILKEKYMNGSHLDVLKSMFNMILLHHTEGSSDDEFNLPYLDPSILNLLTSFKLASLKDTSEGYAMLSNFKSINDMVIVKTSKTKKDNKSILFEYFIGTIGINKLRTLIPNFTYTLAIFKCNPLPISEDKKIDIKRFCKEESEDTRFYVVYEKIKGMSIDDFVHRMLDDDDVHRLLTYIIQIAFALIIAQREIGYVHYDLHTDNIILRKLPSPKVIEYDIDGKTYRIETDAIPTIIDYGFSHFVYQGIPVGGKTMPNLGIIPTLTSKGFDLYKLVMYIMNGCFKKRGVNFFNKISWVMDYFTDDPFGIHTAYKTKNPEYINTAFGVGWKKFYNVTPTSPIYHDPPMNFLKWVSQVNKPFWDKSVKVSDSLYNVPSNNIIESYRAKIEGRRIFNSEIMDSIDDCSILDTDHRSYIINKYVSDEFEKILDTFGNYIKDHRSLRKKIKRLSDKSEKNREQYQQNDLALLTIYTDELFTVQNSILLDGYENKLDIHSVRDIKRLNSKMKILCEYIETYNNYRMFIEYSKISSRLTTDSSIDEYKSKAVSIYKKFEQIKSEYIFETLRQQLNIVNEVVYIGTYYKHPNVWRISDTFTDALITLQYIVDDIRFFYPDVVYAYKDIEKMVYKIARDLLKRSSPIYVPPRSEIQFNIASVCSPDDLSYIMYKNFKPRDISISDFINTIQRENMKDGEIYHLLDTKFDKVKHPLSITPYFKSIVESDVYKRLKIDTIKCLDLGSPIMENRTREILDILNVSEKDFITVDLSDIGKRFMNTVAVNSEGKFPFISGYFSIITAFMVLHNVSDIEDRLSEIHRILKPGGLFIMREYDSGTQCQKVVSDIDKILTDRTTIKHQSFYMSSEDWNKLMYTNGFRLLQEKIDSSLTKYTLYTR
ncbi:MAG: methyltransferase domain-containing protein [Candidatus Colwellbacteria bacterium]|nr:methyltransferase domain-containing protein [Candidatus Colwellbacteria bacterium]